MSVFYGLEQNELEPLRKFCEQKFLHLEKTKNLKTVERQQIRQGIRNQNDPVFLEVYLEQINQKYQLGLEFDTYELLKEFKENRKEKEIPKALENCEQEYLIKAYLSRGKPKYQSLGTGIHNNIFYFGTKIFDKEGKSFDAIITSDKKIYVNWGKGKNEIRQDFKLNYRYEFFAECLDYSWDNESIMEWLYENPKTITLKELYEKIRNLNQDYIYHHDKRIHSFIAIDIITGYYIRIFDAKGRTFFRAERRSGKTEQTKIYQLLCFNPFFTADITGSPFFRLVESTSGTPLIDDFDLLPEQQKKDIIQLIRAGYKKDVTSIRADGKNFKPNRYNIFSNLVMNNTLGLDSITTDRCNEILMLRSNNKLLTNNRPNTKDAIWKEIRNQLFISALQNYKEIQKSYEELETEEISSRDLERVKPHLTIAQLIGKEVYEELIGFFKELTEQSQIEDLENDWGYIIIKFLYERIKETRWVTVSEIAEGTQTEALDIDNTNKEYKSKMRGYSTFIGKYLKGYSNLFKARMINGKAQYEIKPETIIQLIKLKNYEKQIPNFIEVNEEKVENTSTGSTTSTSSTTPTSSTKQTKQVEQVEQVELKEEVKDELILRKT